MSPNDRLPPEPPAPVGPATLSTRDRSLVLVTAFLGWLCAGMLMSTSGLVMRDAAIDLLARAGTIDLARFQALNRAVSEQKNAPAGAAPLSSADEALQKYWEALVQKWFAYYQCAFLLGAASGGLAFGRLGDRIGRSRAMACSILCYSLMSGAAYFAQTPSELLVLWFLACLGVGGMWPNGVALLSETWSDLSRPMVAGIMGTSANVGIFGLATLGTYYAITTENWRWVLLVDAAPVVLGLFALGFVPESPRWLSTRARSAALAGLGGAQTSVGEVFRPPFLWVTLVGILLATIPLIGGWGSANWMVPWAAKAGEQMTPPDHKLKAQVSQARSLTGIVGSLLGGWVAHVLGRRRAYCLGSLAALFCAQYTFQRLVPTDASFLLWVSALGFFSGLYFGWLPLFLPELFPTRVRSTGAGVSFNFGRILTAVTVFATGTLTQYFQGDYAHIGQVTSLIFALGAIIIWLAPDTTKRQLAD